MFRLISNLVLRHPRAVLMTWLGLIAGLHFLAPPWNRITRDDNVGFFPPDSPSVVGEDCWSEAFPTMPRAPSSSWFTGARMAA